MRRRECQWHVHVPSQSSQLCEPLWSGIGQEDGWAPKSPVGIADQCSNPPPSILLTDLSWFHQCQQRYYYYYYYCLLWLYFAQGPICVVTLTHCTLHTLQLNHFCNMYSNEKNNLYPVFLWLFLYKYLWFQSNSQTSDISRYEVLRLMLMKIHFHHWIVTKIWEELTASNNSNEHVSRAFFTYRLQSPMNKVASKDKMSPFSQSPH